MMRSTRLFTRLLCSVLLCLACPAAATLAQNTQSAPQDTGDVVRVNTELVQTDVLVLDKQGRFVNNLQREQFELRVDGKPQPISFFERIVAGSANEEAQLAAARGQASTTKGGAAAAARPLDRGRTLVFFVDDIHASADSLARVRRELLRFINQEMGANDTAVVSSTSGQVGFLQQLTSNKAVLRAAVARISYKQYMQTRGESPEISQYQAFAIQERNDQALFNYFVGEVMRDNPNQTPEIAQSIVRNRVQMIMSQSDFYVASGLSSLERFMRSLAHVPGRKLFYFISDGFLMNIRSTNVSDRMRRIADAALRYGAVIYTVDARGLTNEPTVDASRQAFDPYGIIASRGGAEITAPQEPLHKLADDTGGRALINTNALGPAFTQALKETSAYYLLAWRPEPTQARGGKFRRLEVSVKDRPELKVLVQRGYFDTPPVADDNSANAKNRKETEKPAAPAVGIPSSELMSAVLAPRPQTALPTSISLGYTREPAVGMVLTASLEIEDDSLSTTDQAKPAQNSLADVLGVVLNDQGKVVNGFKQELTITPFAGSARPRHSIVSSQMLPMPPGLYQVRVSTRDRRTGRTGSAMEWIEIPDPNKKAFSLSSIFIGERAAGEAAATGDAARPEVVSINPNRRFARNSRLRFNLQIYDAARGSDAQPDVAIQVQVFRDDQPVVTTALRKVTTTGQPDLSRLPYAAEVLLDKLPAGQYVLRVTAIDRIAKAGASQQVNFVIE
jgi:VWFA-related protein